MRDCVFKHTCNPLCRLSVTWTHQVVGYLVNSKSVSVCTSNFCKLLENASVNGERFETEKQCSDVSGEYLLILHMNRLCERFYVTFGIPMRGLTSPQAVVIHCRRSFLGQRLSTQVSWALGFRCNLHMLSGTTTALAPGSVLLQKTLRFFNPRPQVLEH